MAISIVQTPAYVVAGYEGVVANVTFASQPTVGNHIIAIGLCNPAFGGSRTATAVTDNQGNSFTNSYVDAQGGGLVISYAQIATSSGTHTVTLTMPTGSDCAKGLQILEVSGLATSSLVDLSISYPTETNFSTVFNVTTGTTDTAEELVIAAVVPRGSGTPNAISPPANYTELLERISGDALGYICYRITSATGAQSINLSGYPTDGQPAMAIRSFRAAAASQGNLAWIRA